MKVALVGDGFTDRYVCGPVNRLSPEAPVPLLDVDRVFEIGGGVLNVANNLVGLGIVPTVFTISDLEVNFPLISPSGCVPLIKTRFVTENHQLLRVDKPKVYRSEDLERMTYPSFQDYDIIAFMDYCKGTIKGGQATIVDSKKTDFSVFKGSQILKVNKREFEHAINKDFPQMYVTKGKEGIDYYEDGKFISNDINTVREVIDVTGAGDTVTAVLIYCLVHGITEPKEIMALANKAAGIVITYFGTSIVSLEALLAEGEKK